MRSSHTSPPSPDNPQRRDRCPSCQHRTDWHYLGRQEWPEEVARKAGRPAVTILWQCGYCGTTITDTGKK